MTNSKALPVLLLLAGTALTFSAASPAKAAGDGQKDPLESVMWDWVSDDILGEEAEIVFDERVQVYAPATVEDGMNVPVSVSANGLENIAEIRVLADHNPIPHILTFHPDRLAPALAFRVKLQEATPIRAAMRTTDGVWHVGGRWVDAPGGGCTTASASQASRLWETALNRVQARLWPRDDGSERLRLRIIHPMDTGLVDAIPAFYMAEMRIADSKGQALGRLQTHEPVSENPLLTFTIPASSLDPHGYRLGGGDSDGNNFSVLVPGSVEAKDSKGGQG